MPRYRLLIEYDGTPFAGWQIQATGISVQGVLAAAIEAFCGERAHVQGAGRTDAGVHALGQVAHVDLAKETDPETVRDALNAHLRPHPVAVLSAEIVAEDFDARFSARRRHYLYRIVNRRADLALDRSRAWRIARPLDAPAMHRAAQHLVGKYDFTTFRAAECQAKSPVKTLDRLDIARHGDELRVRSCTIRCARWSARSRSSAKASGSPTMLRARSRRATAQPADRWHRLTGFIWSRWSTTRMG